MNRAGLGRLPGPVECDDVSTRRSTRPPGFFPPAAGVASTAAGLGLRQYDSTNQKIVAGINGVAGAFTAKPDLGFSPKPWEDRQVPAPALLSIFLRPIRDENAADSFSRRREAIGNSTCLITAIRLQPAPDSIRRSGTVKTFRSTYATRMLRSGFDVRLQCSTGWGAGALRQTMRYLAPQKDVHDLLDEVQIAGVPPQ